MSSRFLVCCFFVCFVTLGTVSAGYHRLNEAIAIGNTGNIHMVL